MKESNTIYVFEDASALIKNQPVTITLKKVNSTSDKKTSVIVYSEGSRAKVSSEINGGQQPGLLNEKKSK